MLQGSLVIAVALGYIGLLFVVASYGDRARRIGRGGRWQLIYPLSLAIYCTSWTFFGSVGLASRTGFDFLTIYLGPILMIGLCSPLIMRIVQLAKAQNITSIADFIAARYGKAQTVAATVALIAIIGTIPYIALQLKAVSSSLSTILGQIGPEAGVTQPVLADISLFVALSMATFVVPIALAGLLTFGAGPVDSDMYVLALPLAARSDLFTLAAFVGGLSAATAMVIVESVALAIMVSNDIVMPLVLQRRDAFISGRYSVGWLLLTVRRIAIFAILFLAYMYYRMAGDAQLASIGLLSFAAIAQLAPAFFGGLIWRRATARGAMAGMTVGILIWAYTLLLPSFADAGIVGGAIVNDGPWGIAWLRPQALFGLDLPRLVHGVLWSLSLNVIAYVAFSFSRAPASIERVP